MTPDLLIVGAAEVAAPVPDEPGRVRRIAGGLVAIEGETVAAAGPREALEDVFDLSGAETLDAAGGLVVPGFVDCHTHLVYGGSRAAEYAARLTGEPAALEALAGPTGIPSSVRATRAASDEELQVVAMKRLDAMLAQGTTTAESKTGYGLDAAHELRLLRLNRLLDAAHDVDVVSTLMAAHAFPPGTAPGTADARRWVDEIVSEIVPAAAAEGAVFNDVFCDEGYFDAAESRRILSAGRDSGLAPKIHADQYARLGASRLAAELEVVSADHLNLAEDAELAALAEAGVTGVLMPLIDFVVAHPAPVDARRWVRASLPIGLATDLCPGGPAVSMPLAMQFACRVSGLTPEQALWAATAGGARALALDDRGAFDAGLLADVVVIDVPGLDDLVHRLGHAPVRRVVRRGRVIERAESEES